MPSPEPTDEQLLTSGDAEDFGRFYDRHIDVLLGWFARRVGDPDTAADLAAETFAAALAARRRWLYGIAQHKLADCYRRGSADDRICRRLGLSLPRQLDEEDREMIELLARDSALALVDALPGDQRDAVLAHVFEDEDYETIAASEHTSPAAIRKRVSRGLAGLRRRLGVHP
jgi:DNA-directed RNA polymerase specialized sigma24 family protein